MSDLLDTNESLTKNESSEFVKKIQEYARDSDNAYVECMKKLKICSPWPLKYNLIAACSTSIEFNISSENIFSFFFNFSLLILNIHGIDVY